MIAIITTIMVLELRAPHGSDIHDLRPLLPALSSYVMSFVYVGIYWNNHHHLLQATEYVNGRILWANLHLLWGRSGMERWLRWEDVMTIAISDVCPRSAPSRSLR